MAETINTGIAFELTEKQLKFLENCEIEFNNRYTEEDSDYKLIEEVGIEPPPIVDPWYHKPRRDYNWVGEQKEGHNRYQNLPRKDRNRNSDRSYGDNYGNSKPQYWKRRYN